MKKRLFTTMLMLGIAAATLGGATILNGRSLAVGAAATTNAENAVYVSQISGWTSGNRHSGINFTLDAGSKVTPTGDTVLVIDYENLSTTDNYVSFYLNTLATTGRINDTNKTPKGALYLFNGEDHVRTYEVSTGTADIFVKNSEIGSYNKMAIKLSHFINLYTEGVEMNLNTLFFSTRLNLSNLDRTKSDNKGFVKGIYVSEYDGGATLDLSSAVRVYTPQAGTFVSVSGIDDYTAKYLAMQGQIAIPASFDIYNDGNGTLEFAGGAYAGFGADLIIKPNEHYVLRSLLVNGVDVTGSVLDSKYHVSSLSTSDFYATATFEIYTAVRFAGDFLSQTDTICSSGGDSHLAALEIVWPDLAANYAYLDVAEKANLVDSNATDEDILSAILRYEYICGKYNSSSTQNLVEFIEDLSVTHSSVPLTLFGNENSADIGVIVMLAISLLSAATLGVMISRKRRKNIAK